MYEEFTCVNGEQESYEAVLEKISADQRGLNTPVKNYVEDISRIMDTKKLVFTKRFMREFFKILDVDYDQENCKFLTKLNKSIKSPKGIIGKILSEERIEELNLMSYPTLDSSDEVKKLVLLIYDTRIEISSRLSCLGWEVNSIMRKLLCLTIALDFMEAKKPSFLHLEEKKPKKMLNPVYFLDSVADQNVDIENLERTELVDSQYFKIGKYPTSVLTEGSNILTKLYKKKIPEFLIHNNWNVMADNDEDILAFLINHNKKGDRLKVKKKLSLYYTEIDYLVDYIVTNIFPGY